jgi:pSer/pThr/pTyr-binding forkhead associated (FHA) protein
VVHIFCTNCGHRNQADANFCSSCGQALPRETEDPQTITFAIDGSSLADEVEVDRADVGAGGVLVATRGPNAGSEFALEHVITTAGRHPDSDIFLDDVTVSRRHAELERTTTGYVVRDVGSLNGTYLNQQLVHGDQPVVNGDELQIGRFKLVFIAGSVS